MVLSKYVTICPIGSIEKEILEHVKECITNRSGLVCKLSPGIEKPEYAYNETRCQYNAKTILQRLRQHCSDETLKLIGITKIDLYVPVLKYVFGVSEIDGQCSLISLHRLRPQFYENPENHNLLVARARKTALHELGHSFGLTHCRKLRCVMYSSTKIEDTDCKQPEFCPTCLELVKWNL